MSPRMGHLFQQSAAQRHCLPCHEPFFPFSRSLKKGIINRMLCSANVCLTWSNIFLAFSAALLKVEQLTRCFFYIAIFVPLQITWMTTEKLIFAWEERYTVDRVGYWITWITLLTRSFFLSGSLSQANWLHGLFCLLPLPFLPWLLRSSNTRYQRAESDILYDNLF